MKITLRTPVHAPHGLLAWTLSAAAALLSLALLLTLPVGAMLFVVLVGAIGAGLGLAELRRHGGPGVPTMPFGTDG